jgi:dolichyl-diphosphooligosaccharide--protein glycosyltransferase
MAETPVDVLLKGKTGRNTRGLLRIIILCTIAAAAVASRLFSVIRKSSRDQNIHLLAYQID